MHEFLEKFEANLAAGLDRPEAMRQARGDDPDGFDDYIREHNERHQPTDAQRRAFAG